MTEDEAMTIQNACRRGPNRCGMDYVAGRCVAAFCPRVGPAELSASKLVDDWLQGTLNSLDRKGRTVHQVRREDLLLLVETARKVPAPQPAAGRTHQVTPAEAEELAKRIVGEYLTACRLAGPDPETIGNVLMKLASVTGCVMANAEGADIAFDRLLGTAQFVLRTMPKTPARLHPVQ